MKIRKIVAGAVSVCLAGGGAVAVAQSGRSAAVPTKTTIKESGGLTVKPNRYVKDTMRWHRDVYRVKSGGTLHVVNNIISQGPHTFTVVKRSDLPRTARQLDSCRICRTLEQAHGVPEGGGPPKYFFLENGVGSDRPPSIDRPGDSALVGPGQKRTESIDLKVTAKKGTTLYFMCLVHRQMQAKVIVG